MIRFYQSHSKFHQRSCETADLGGTHQGIKVEDCVGQSVRQLFQHVTYGRWNGLNVLRPFHMYLTFKKDGLGEGGKGG